jgi:hypothetical protein
MRMITKNSLLAFRWVASVDIGALAVTLVASAALAACSAAVPDAEKALSAASKKADGIYGISPTILQLRASNKANYTSLNVYSSVAGVQTPLSTNFNTGYITGLTTNTTYALKVHGVSSAGETALPLNEYISRTWPTFASSTWSLSETSKTSLEGSTYRITWNYLPWSGGVPPGDGAREGTMVRCYFVPGTQPNPFVSVKVKDALVSEGGMDINSAVLGMSASVRVGCEVRYIDGTISQHATTRLANFAPAVGACPAAQVTVYDAAAPYTCNLTTVGGADIDPVSYSLQIDSSSNTCGFVTAASPNLSGAPFPTDLNLTPSETCNLRYRMVGPGFSSDILNTVITVKNVQPVWEQFPTTKTIREISPNDPAVPLTSPGVVNRAGILAASVGSPAANYRLMVTDVEMGTNKERQGNNYSSQFGRYFLDTTTSTSCTKFGQVGYADAGSAGGVASGIEPKTGAFIFLPFDHFYGSCTVDVYFDDGQTANHRSVTRSLNVVVEGYNDPPNLAAPTLSPSGYFTCGDGGHCYVGIDYDIPLKADVGGINDALTSLNESSNQTVFLKPGKCIASPGSEAYLKVSYCQLDASKNLIISFTPLAKPPVGVDVSVSVRVSDNGLNSMPSARYPVTAGNSASNACIRTTDCGGPFPDTNRDSVTRTFKIDIDEFNLPLKPALIVSKGACLACHAKINGDLITDFGNSGTGSRFTNMFFKDDITPTMLGDNEWFSNRASHYQGFQSLDALTNGSLYTKRAQIKPDAPGKVNQSKFLANVSWVDSAGVTHAAPSTTPINLLDFITGRGFRATNIGNDGNQGSWVTVGCALGACTDANSGVSVKDTLPSGDAIDFMRIDAPIPSDIRSIAQQASPGSGGYSIPWTLGGANWANEGAAFGALYRVPDVGSDESRPFSGLAVSTKQPYETVQNNAPPADVPSYVRNVGVINCFGDVVVKGNLFLASPVFNTDSRGCRLHVTGDVIFHAYNGSPGNGITVNSPGSAFGVQITSASSVNFGVARNQLSSYLRQMPATALTFAADIKVPYGNECFNTSTGEVRAPAATCASGFTTATSDTAFYPPGIDGWDHGTINYSKLMINAPVINSRYLGDVKGSVIADYALFRLGQLTFIFDPVFQGQVPFPRLQTVQPNPRVIFNAGLCSKYPKECANGSN